jgi:hypothetical protein
VTSTAPLNPRASEIAAWTTTLFASAAFDRSRKSENGALSMRIGAASFCKTPSSAEKRTSLAFPDLPDRPLTLSIAEIEKIETAMADSGLYW